VTLKYFNVKNGLTTGNITLNAGNSNISANAFIGNINVTSLANLGNVGNVVITGGTSGYVLSTDGTGNLSWVAQSGGGGGTPGGANTQVQYNSSGSFAGNSSFTFNEANSRLSVTNVTVGNSFNLATGTTLGVLYRNALGEVVTGANLTFNGASLTVGGGVTADDFYGNLRSGSSNIRIIANSNVNISSAGNANVVVVTGTGINVAGTLNATGNANVGNIGATNGVFTNVSGNGSALTSLTGANVTGAVAYATTANSVAVANVTGIGNIATVNLDGNASTVLYGNGVFAAPPGGTYGNANVASFLASYGSNTIVTTGNITAGNFIGNGQALSGLNGSNVTGQVANALVAGTVYTNAQPNITSVGLLTALSVGPNSSITLTGTSGFVKANSLQGTDSVNAVYLGYNGVTGAVGVTSNLTVGIGTAGNITANGNVTASYFIGNGSSLSSIAGGNVTGQVGFAAVANSVAGANVTGQVANALVAGTVYTNAQPNITSVGTLTGLTSNGTVNFTNSSNVSLGAVGNIKITGGTANYVLRTDGAGNLSWVAQSGGGGTPGGANTQIQFNDGSTFGGNAGLTFDKTTTTLTANNFIATSTANLGNVGNVRITGGTANYVLSTDGTGNLNWVAQSGGGGGGGATITDNTSANTTYYPVYATANSGSFTTAGITTTKLQFVPSTGQLTVQDLNMLSDATLKENAELITDPFSILSQIFGMGFNWKDSGKKSYGVLAQMLEKVLPELVSTNAQGVKTVNYIPIIAFLVEAVKQQQADIDQLKQKR
jgi:hypothetical protein